MGKLNLVYSTDDGYVQHLAVSMLSLLENNRHIEEIKVYILDNQISEGNKNELKKICDQYKRRVEFIPINKVLDTIELNTDFNVSAYARLFMTSFIKEDRALYLDCDTIVLGSLEPLIEMDIQNYYLAAVQDTVSKELRYAVNVSDEYRYINSGVLYINLEKWRENNIENQFKKCIIEHQGNVPHHDQGTINSVCKDKILIIDIRYNIYDTALFYKSNELCKMFDLKKYYSQLELDEAKNNPVIIHFTPAHYGRPWFRKCTHPYVNEYKEFLKKTKWRGNIVKEYDEINRNTRRKIKKLLYKIVPFKWYCSLIKKMR